MANTHPPSQLLGSESSSPPATSSTSHSHSHPQECIPQTTQPSSEPQPSTPKPNPPTGPSTTYRPPKPHTPITYLEIPRIFYPSSLCIARPPTPQHLTTYNPHTHLTHPLFHTPTTPSPHPHTDTQTIVVAFTTVQTSLGIFFGPNSKHNFSLLLDRHMTKMSVEVFAAKKALKLARAIANVFGPDRVTVMRVVLVTACAAVVGAMTQCVEGVGRRVFEGVGEGRALERLDRLVEEAVDEDALEVEFWLVGREGVSGAEELARGKVGGGALFE